MDADPGLINVSYTPYQNILLRITVTDRFRHRYQHCGSDGNEHLASPPRSTTPRRAAGDHRHGQVGGATIKVRTPFLRTSFTDDANNLVREDWRSRGLVPGARRRWSGIVAGGGEPGITNTAATVGSTGGLRNPADDHRHGAGRADADGGAPPSIIRMPTGG